MTAWCPDVDDLLQETLVRAWRLAKSYRADGPVDKWLVKIAQQRRLLSDLESQFQQLAAEQASCQVLQKMLQQAIAQSKE